MSNSANTKRIAKNTLLLYFRMFFSMAIALYTSRVVLQTLGVEDFGIYNVVGGVVVLFSFINASMGTATSRFLTFEIGKGEAGNLRTIFSTAFYVHLAIAFILFILAETVGLWFLNNKLVIPASQLRAAQIVYQCSVISTIVSITQVP
ncbi:MAG: polysaccharide biosynthesis protein, partial [Tannerellaceae bacterium]